MLLYVLLINVALLTLEKGFKTMHSSHIFWQGIIKH